MKRGRINNLWLAVQWDWIASPPRTSSDIVCEWKSSVLWSKVHNCVASKHCIALHWKIPYISRPLFLSHSLDVFPRLECCHQRAFSELFLDTNVRLFCTSDNSRAPCSPWNYDVNFPLLSLSLTHISLTQRSESTSWELRLFRFF